MAIRVALPTDIHNTTLNIEGLNGLKEYLIKVFENLGSRRHMDKVPLKKLQ